MGLIIAESFKRFFEVNRSKSRIAHILLQDTYTTTEFANYIARRGDMISFLPAGKEHTVNDNGDWKRENRQISRAGKLARKLIDSTDIDTLELKDTDFELFSNLIKADKINDEDCQVQFIEVKGKDIKYRYNENNHSKLYTLGQLGDSCMRYEGCERYFNIYVKNPDKVSMLVMVDCENNTVGRALVWNTNKGMFMDRVYATDAHQKMFENYAEEKGWMYKKVHSNDVTGNIVKDGESERRYLTVELDEYEFDEYPYVDTLCYLSDTGKISNDSSYNDKELRSTSGSWEQQEQEDDHDNECWDEENEEWISEENAMYIQSYGYVHYDNAVLDDYTDNYIRKRDAQRLANGKWCHENNANETEDGWVHDDDLDDYEYINGTYYNRKDSCVMDSLTDEYILESESVELYDGNKTHEDSREIVEMDSSYGNNIYWKKDCCTKCVYADTWFLTEDTVLLYSDNSVSQTNLEACVAEGNEIVIADNQLTMELHG